jgi:hypothetical protein
MDNVQNCDSYIDVASSQTYRSYFFLTSFNGTFYLQVLYMVNRGGYVNKNDEWIVIWKEEAATYSMAVSGIS